MTTRGHHGILLGASGGPPPIAYLDDYSPAPRVAYSLKKVVSGATQCLEMYRLATGTYVSYGFVGENVDSSAMVAYIVAGGGGGEGRVSRLYDQSGNAQHTNQLGSGSNPTIISAFSYLGKIDFDGTGDRFVIPTLTLGTGHLGVYIKHKLDSIVAGTQILFEVNPDWATTAQGYIIYTSGATIVLGARNATGVIKQATFTPSPALNSLGVTSFLFKRTGTMGATELQVYRDGVAMTATMNNDPAAGLTGNFATADAGLGARPSTGSNSVGMEMYTFVAYNADTTSIRTDIEAVIA